MPRQRRQSTTSSRSTERDTAVNHEELRSMYDYLAKIILLGPSGCGKSCLLHRFVKGEWRTLSSQTIGVEFASKIVKVGPPGRRKRVKLQLWDTAGTERFRSVSRSYYRGAAGAVLVYDVANQASFSQLQTFLNDAKALASPQLSVLLAGNKTDLADPEASQMPQNLIDDDAEDGLECGSLPSIRSNTLRNINLSSQQRATISPTGRAVTTTTASTWASANGITATTEVSALSGDGVEEIFNKLARTILTKIELGEINPDDPMSGIQYGDADYLRYVDEDGTSASIKSGLTADGYGSSVRKRRKGKGGGMREWGTVFRLGGRPGSSRGGGGGGGGGDGKCC